MRTIIAGSRTGVTMQNIISAVERCGWRPSVVISGCAQGADRLGEMWAAQQGIPVERFPANWEMHGKSAGYRRNAEMAATADALIALWDGTSRGTKHMIDIARSRGLRVYVRYVA